MKNNKIKSYLISPSFLIAGAILLLGLLVSFDKPSDRYFQIAKNMEVLSSVYAEVNKVYVDEVNPSDFMKKGIDAMLGSLDPYTNYIPEDDIEDFRFMSTGQYGGIGAIIGNRNGKTLVLMPYEGFPAQKAGLRVADEIIKIDGRSTEGLNTSEVSKLLKGQANTKIAVTIQRYGTEKPFDITLEREKIKVNNVPYYGMITSDVGYMDLKDFTSDASKEIKNALLKLKEKGANKFILDLRGNPGGLLNEAIAISNIFIPKGKEIVSTKGKVEKWNSTHLGRDIAVDTESPLVILTNSRSASASEIVSGVIQDYDRGVLIGKRTFGKGLVQATLPVAHNAKVKVTTAKYYIPSGRCIQAIDYSNRNPDGSVGKVPDSLITEFKTKNGRKVFDGGGVNPDITTKQQEVSEILRGLVNQNMLFDYATEYYFKNKENVSSPKEFILTDSEYNEFVSWLTTKEFTYKNKVERRLENLNELIEKDSLAYLNISSDLKAIEEKVKNSKKEELLFYKKEIKALLEEDIVSRKFYQKGMLESALQHDNDIKEALALFNDTKRYNSLLGN
ncbi:MAG: S41 family peptidase [Cyclobacteriaceae bacterium]